MKNKKTIIFSNYDLYKQYDEVEEMLTDETGVQPSENAIWDEIYSTNESDWEWAKYDLEKFFANKECIFVGSIGRWDGTYAGGKIGEFFPLLNSLLEDCADFELYEENEHFYIHGSHHDGDVFMEVKILTDKGYDYSENWAYGYSQKYNYSQQEMHKRIMNCSFLSRLPRFSKKVYGI